MPFRVIHVKRVHWFVPGGRLWSTHGSVCNSSASVVDDGVVVVVRVRCKKWYVWIELSQSSCFLARSAQKLYPADVAEVLLLK